MTDIEQIWQQHGWKIHRGLRILHREAKAFLKWDRVFEWGRLFHGAFAMAGNVLYIRAAGVPGLMMRFSIFSVLNLTGWWFEPL